PPFLRPEPPVSWSDRAELAGGSFVNANRMDMVQLPGGWWAARFETVQFQYEKIMGTNPSMFQDPFRPVECVSWNDATEFCRRLTESEGADGKLPAGHVYRLPTESEFAEMAEASSSANAVTSSDGLRWATEPAGSLRPNALGLHDVIGNVWEWCLDWHDSSK